MEGFMSTVEVGTLTLTNDLPFVHVFFLHSHSTFLGYQSGEEDCFFRHHLLSTAATWHSSRLLVPTGSYDLPSGPDVQSLISLQPFNRKWLVCVFE